MPPRDTALKMRIKDITGGQLKKGKSDWESFLLTPLNEEASRVRVLASVVSCYRSENGKYANLTLDDTTDTITSRTFEGDVQLIEGIKEGDIVDVIGRVKEHNNEKYISAESVCRLSDPNWELVRKLELAIKSRAIGGNADLPKDSPADEELVEEDSSSVVVGLIGDLDEGGGVKYVQIAEATGLDDETMEKILTKLMESGDIYEPKIGKFKRV